MSSIFRMGLLALLLLGGVGCTSVSSSVQVFHQLPAGLPAGSSFIVAPPRDELRNSIEFATYSDLLANLLTARGLRMAGPDEAPRFGFVLDYDIDGGTILTTGYTSSVGYDGSVSTTADRERVFQRVVVLRIVERDPASDSYSRVYEGTLRSEGSCGALTDLMPYFLNAFFEDFPGRSGTTRQVQSRPRVEVNGMALIGDTSGVC
jgi:hypothetical protein